MRMSATRTWPHALRVVGADVDSSVKLRGGGDIVESGSDNFHDESQGAVVHGRMRKEKGRK